VISSFTGPQRELITRLVRGYRSVCMSNFADRTLTETEHTSWGERTNTCDDILTLLAEEDNHGATNNAEPGQRPFEPG
jgi:hypothetical protein